MDTVHGRRPGVRPYGQGIRQRESAHRRAAGNVASIATYGEYQSVIVDAKITSVPEAQQRAQAAILQFGHPVYDVKFNTLVPGCAIGQAITVNLPAFGIRQTARHQARGGGGIRPRLPTAMLEYQVECIGSDNVTFTDLMTTLLQQEANQTTVDDSTVNENLEILSEGITSRMRSTRQPRPPPLPLGQRVEPDTVRLLPGTSPHGFADRFPIVIENTHARRSRKKEESKVRSLSVRIRPERSMPTKPSWTLGSTIGANSYGGARSRWCRRISSSFR